LRGSLGKHRTITIQETSPTTLNLTSDQAQQIVSAGKLLAGRGKHWADAGFHSLESPSALDLRKGIQDDEWALTVRNAVGVLGLTDLTIIVIPKIPESHFLFIASASIPEARFAKSPARSDGSSAFIAVLFRHFIATCEDVIRHGVFLDYRTEQEDLSHPRGKIKLLKTHLNLSKGRARVVCDHTTFSEDNFVNRLIKGALQKVASSQLIDRDSRRKASQLSGRINSGVATLTDMRKDPKGAPPRFRNLMALAIVVILSELGHKQGQKQGMPTYLIPTPGLIESGIRHLLRNSLADSFEVKERGAKRTLAPSKLTINPDILVESGSSALATGDVKYRLSEQFWTREFLYQACTFATAFDAKKGFVISFADKMYGGLQSLAIGEKDLMEVQWPASEDTEPETALEFVTFSLGHWLTRS
jgi:5-methylcytosine-specific restriction enzyme subunit McrC